MNDRLAWYRLKTFFKNLFEINRVDDFKVIVKDLIYSFLCMGISMNVHIHFLNNHLDFFARHLSIESIEQGYQIHQITIPMDNIIKEKKLDALLGEVCWWSHKMFLYPDHNALDDGEGHTERDISLNILSHSNDTYSDDELLTKLKKAQRKRSTSLDPEYYY